MAIINVKRIINVSDPVPITPSTIVLKNNGDTLADVFPITVHPSEAASVHEGSKSNPIGFPMSAVPVGDTATPGGKNFGVTLRTPFEPGMRFPLDVRMDDLGAI